MEYISIETPQYPSFILSGSALYRPGDEHRKRTDIRCFNIIFIEYGDLYIEDGNHRYHLEKHDVLIIHPNRVHFGYKVCTSETLFHWLHFNTSESFEFTDCVPVSSPSNKGFSYYENTKAKIILPSYQSLSADSYSQIISYLKQIESIHLSRYSQLPEKNMLTSNPIQNQINFLKIISVLSITQNKKNLYSVPSLVLNYLQSNYGEPITLEQLSKIGNCHPTHLIRCFKKIYNTTPLQALINIRLQQSTNLLVNTNYTCQEISRQCGFESLSYYSNTFKKHYNHSPTEYRKLARKECSR